MCHIKLQNFVLCSLRLKVLRLLTKYKAQSTKYHSSNRINLQGGVTLPVTTRAFVLFATLLLEDNNFLIFAVVDHCRRNLVLGASAQEGVELDGASGVRLD